MLRRATKITIEVLAVVLTGLAVAIGAAGWRLSQGPVSLEFLSPYVERALTPDNGAYAVKIDETVVTWGGWERPVVVHAVGIRAIKPKGEVLARVPEATVRFSARALLRGVIAPTSLVMHRPRLTLERDKDGRFSVGLGRPGKAGKAGKPAPVPREILDNLFGDGPTGRFSYLKSIRIVDAAMTIRDRHLGVAWQAPRANLELVRGPEGLRMIANLDINIRGRKIRLRSVGLYGRATRTAEITVSFSGLEPGLFAQRGGPLAILNALDAVRVSLNGHAILSIDKEGRLARVAFELAGKGGSIALPPYRQSLLVKTLVAKGRILGNFDTVVLDGLTIDFGGPRVEARGKVTGLGGRAKARLTASILKVPVDELSVYWPVGVAESSRRWVLANIREGTVPQVDAAVEASFGGGKEPEFKYVRGAFLFRGLTVAYLTGLPPVTGLDGSGRFTEDRIDFRVRRGRLAGLTLRPSTVTVLGMTNPDPIQQRTIIDAVLRGPLGEALKIIDRKPLRYATKVGVKPSQASGQATIKLHFDFPLLDALTMDEVEITSTANVSNFTWRAGLYGIDLTGGVLKLELDKNSMVVKGRVNVGSKPARVAWVERFDDRPQFRRQVTIEGHADEKLRKAFGLAVAPFVEGPFRVKVKLTSFTAGADLVEATIDLKQATLSLPFLGWRKAAGTDGTARMTVRLAGGRVIAIPRLSIEAAGFSAKGFAKMAKGGKRLATLELKQVRLGRTDLALSVSGRESGGYAVVIKGASLDGARLFEGERTTKPGAAAKAPRPDLSLQFSVARVYFAKDRYISSFRGRAARIGGTWTDVHFDGFVSPGNPLKVRFAQRGPGRALAVTSTDAGGTLRALNIMDNVVGGRLDVRGSIVDRKDSSFAGRVTMRDYRLIKAPILQQITSQGALKETTGTLAKPRGVKFREFVAPFTYKDGRLTIRNGRAISADLGVTFQGRLDLRALRLEIDGTVVPVYTLNSILGRVPLIGRILVGEKHGGVFAAAYTAEGPLSKPKLTVHPLSVLTPGMLRGLWRKFRGDEPRSAENPNPKPKPTPR